MGWDQNDRAESVDQFLMRLTGIGSDFLKKEIERRLKKMKLKVVSIEDIDGNWFCNVVKKKITLSDGRVFVHRIVSSASSDDWGEDYWEFREESEVIKVQHENLCD